MQAVENSGSESEDVALPEDGHSVLEANGPDDASEAGEDGTEGEDEEWEGTGVSMDVDGEPHHERGGKPKKPPTGDEVRAIKEATDLFRSSSFKLQVRAACSVAIVHSAGIIQLPPESEAYTISCLNAYLRCVFNRLMLYSRTSVRNPLAWRLWIASFSLYICVYPRSHQSTLSIPWKLLDHY